MEYPFIVIASRSTLTERERTAHKLDHSSYHTTHDSIRKDTHHVGAANEGELSDIRIWYKAVSWWDPITNRDMRGRGKHFWPYQHSILGAPQAPSNYLIGTAPWGQDVIMCKHSRPAQLPSGRPEGVRKQMSHWVPLKLNFDIYASSQALTTHYVQIQ